MKDATRVLIYSHDTFGLGHLRRCREIAHALVGKLKRLHVLIASGSSIAGAFEFRARVDFVKIPSVIKLHDGEYKSLAELIDIKDTLELRRSLLYKTAELYKPSIIIVDKEPLGLRGELEPTLDLAKRRGTHLVLGLREVLDSPELLRAEWAKANALTKIDHYYDEIWVYGCKDFYNPLSGLDVPRHIEDRVRYMGYLKRTMPARAPVSTPFKDYVLVTVGGGGDGAAVIQQIFAAREAVPALDIPLVVVLGPFMPSGQRRQFARWAKTLRNVQVIEFESRFESLIHGAQGVVAMAGYNTFCEILSFDKPALLLPRAEPRKEQTVRATRAAELDLVDMMTEQSASDPVRLAEAIQALPRRAPPSQSGNMPNLGGLKRITRTLAAHIQANSAERLELAEAE